MSTNDPIKERAQSIDADLRDLIERHPPEWGFALATLEGARMVIQDLLALFDRVDRMAVLLDVLNDSGGEIGQAARLLAAQLELSLEVFDPLKQDLIIRVGSKLWQVTTVDVRSIVHRAPDLAEFTLEMRGRPPSADARPGIIDRPVMKRDGPVTPLQLSQFAQRLHGAMTQRPDEQLPIREHLSRSDLCVFAFGDPWTHGCARRRAAGHFCAEHARMAMAGRCQSAGHLLRWSTNADRAHCERCGLEFMGPPVEAARAGVR